MADWGSLIDKQLREAIEAGEFSNLPGEGKPLNLDTDKHTPDDLKMAHKILRDNDLAPDWIMQGKELDAKIEQVVTRLRKAFAAYQAALAQPSETDRIHAESGWKRVQDNLKTAVERLNRDITSYNLKVPPGVGHRPLFHLQREIDRLKVGG